jgi:hypothetical protein
VEETKGPVRLRNDYLPVLGHINMYQSGVGVRVGSKDKEWGFDLIKGWRIQWLQKMGLGWGAGVGLWSLKDERACDLLC